METNEITLEKLKEAISVMENSNREPQKLSEILPLVLVVLKDRAKDMERAQRGEKFYAPSWVRGLLCLLDDKNAVPLSREEYFIFRDMVSRLSMDDYKPANPGLFGHEVQYSTPQRINEAILALKHYFGLM